MIKLITRADEIKKEEEEDSKKRKKTNTVVCLSNQTRLKGKYIRSLNEKRLRS